MNPSWLARHDGLVSALQVLGWLLLLGAALPSVARALSGLDRRTRVALVALSVLAFCISAFWFPVFDKFQALGHEASYAECFHGASTPSAEHGWQPYVTYSLLRWGYWAIGGIVGRDEIGALQVFNMGLRALTVLWMGLTAWVVFRRSSAAVLAALLLAVHPTHAFWGTTIYNVPIPFFFATLCVLLAVIAWREGSALILAAAAATGCLVVATRIEWGILTVGLALLLFGGLGAAWGRSEQVRRPAFWWPTGLVVLVYGITIFGGAGAGALSTQGGYHDISGYFETMARQVWILDFFEPLHRPWALLMIGVGVVFTVRRVAGGPRLVASLFGFVLVAHAAVTTFNDYAYRHDLLAGIGALLLTSTAGPAMVDAWRTGGSSRALAAGTGLLLLATLGSAGAALQTNVTRYYVTVEEFQATHPGFESERLSREALEDGSCYLITDNERLWEMGLAGSHFNLMEPGEAALHWQEHDGCIKWLFDVTDYRVDGLAVRSRALKVQRWFDWELIGHASFPDGNEAVVYRMTSPPWGLTEPPEGWRWGEEEVGGEEERAVQEVGGEEERAEEQVGGEEERGEVESP